MRLSTGWVAGGVLLLCGAVQAEPMHEHRVVQGESLISVRDRLLEPRIGWRQLQKLNRVANPYRLQPGSVLRFPTAWLRERPTTAEVLQLSGKVWLERAGQRLALSPGEFLRDGDVLVSEAQSSAMLRFADGSRSLLRPLSQLSLTQLRQRRDAALGARSRVELQRGALDTEVPPRAQPASAPPRFELRTPVANLGVRGTRLRSHWMDGRLALEVLEGRVVASAAQGGAAETVQAGEGWLNGLGRAPLLPAPQLEALQGRVLERLPVQLQWPGAAGAVAWRVQWLDARGERLLSDTETAQPQFIGAAELPDGVYRLRVRARAANGLEGRDAELDLRLAARPEPPLLETPVAQAQSYAERLRFAWTRPQGAVRWRLQLASDAAFAQTVSDVLVDRNEADLPLLLGTQHWRVASLLADGHQGPWSDPQQLTRLPLPPSPPPAEPRRDGDQMQLRWAQSPLPGARWQVQVDRAGSDFGSAWLDQTVDQPELAFKLQHSGPQQMRIRTLTADGQPGPWGSVQQFEGKSEPWWLLALPLLLLAL